MSDPGDPVDGGADGQAALALPARDAARAMARRIVKSVLRRAPARRARQAAAIRCALPAWAPLLLRWARKALAVAGRSAAATRMSGLTAGTGTMAHWHFHATQPRAWERAPAAPRTADPSGPRRQPGQANPPSRDRGHPGSVSAPERGAGRHGGGASGRDPARAGVDRVFAAALPHGAGTDARKAPRLPRTGALAASPRRHARAPAPVQWAPKGLAGGAARAPQAPGARLFHAGGPASPGALVRDQVERARGGASAGIASTSMVMAARRLIKAAVAPTPRGQSPRAPASDRWWELPPAARAQATRALSWARRQAAVAGGTDGASAPSAWGAHRERAWRANTPAAAATASARRNAPSDGAPDIAMRRQPALAWPATANGPGRARAMGSAGPVSPPSPHPAPAATPQVANRAPANSGHAGDGGAARPPVIDPALANRLADEVMRRIDHRARIERERRGL